MMRISIAQELAKWPFAKFAKWHKISLPHDPMTAEQRFVEIGGKLPNKNPVKQK